MNNESNIKEVFYFDRELYNKSTWVKKFIINLTIVVTFVVFIASAVAAACAIFVRPGQSFLGFFISMSFGLVFLSFFILVILITYYSNFLMDDLEFVNKCFEITNDNRFVVLKFRRHDSFYGGIINYIRSKKDIEKNNKELEEKIKSLDFGLNDLSECLEIINVYKIRNYLKFIKVKCDYNDLTDDTGYKRKTIIIYKYYNNYNEIIRILKSKKLEPKKEVNKDNPFYDNMEKSALKVYNDVFAIGFSVFYVFSGFNIIFIVFFLSYFLCFKIMAYRYLDDDEVDKKARLLSMICVYFLLIIIYLVIYFIIYR